MGLVEARGSEFHTRRATISDSRLLAEVGTETFSDSFAVDNTPENMAAYVAESFSPAKQARELADPATRFLIVEDHNSTVGYARLRFGGSPDAVKARRPVEIVRFYARRPWIGKGVGAHLMRACLAEARREACDVIWLDVWERNPRAIAFYRKWGFEEVGRQTFQLGNDLQHDVLMARPIASSE